MGHIQTAVGMFNAGEVLREYSLRYNIGTPDEKARRNSTVIPMVMAYIFGIEVGVKALIETQRQDPPRIHDLEELYGRLPVVVREKVEQKAATTGVSSQTLQKLLSYHKNSFEEWRYRGDFGGTLVVQPDAIAAVLRAIIEAHTEMCGAGAGKAEAHTSSSECVPPQIEQVRSEYMEAIYEIEDRHQQGQS